MLLKINFNLFIMKFDFRVLFLIVVVSLFLGGCGTQPPKTEVHGDPLSKDMPFSKGPSSEPNIKGPSNPPPQAVTETDDIKVTLP